MATKSIPDILASNEDKASELSDLLKSVSDRLIAFLADRDSPGCSHNSILSVSSNGIPSIHKATGPNSQAAALLTPEVVTQHLRLVLAEESQGKEGLIRLLDRILETSLNTWNQGFMHKLYAGTNPVGVISELVLAVLNTNLHVYTVSPALSVIEKQTTTALAHMFGLREEFSGGISQPGGSASNFSSVLIARHRAFPSIKSEGLQGYRPVMFTSSESHYSLEKAAQMCGLGSAGVRKVASDNEGRMIVEELRRSILDAREEGLHPFYVNATAGTTVRGAYDKIEEIADICEEFKLWLHVDGSLGGSAIFSRKHSWNLRGCERASSITINPHKMLGVPVTCSFLLGRDLRDFWTANSTNAEYLFHLGSQASSNKSLDTNAMYDLADLTPQCGRKGDALKLALGLVYYGRSGYEQYVDAAFEQAAHLASLVEKHPYLCLVGSSVPHSVQVCFYYLPAVFTRQDIQSSQNTAITAYISEELPHKGFMVDYAPGPKGKMLRVVVNGSTRANTAENLVDAITVLGHKYTREVLMDGGRHI